MTTPLRSKRFASDTQLQIISLLCRYRTPEPMCLFLRQLEPDRLIEFCCRFESALRPEEDQAIALLSAEFQSLLDQQSSGSAPTAIGVKEEPTQLSLSSRSLNNCDRADNLFASFYNPDAFSPGARFRKSGKWFGYIRFECVIPAVFPGIKDAVKVNEVSDIPWLKTVSYLEGRWKLPMSASLDHACQDCVGPPAHLHQRFIG